MATPTPGTFPSFPPYQPGALEYSGSEIFLLVTSATATAAATYYDLITNAVGKTPSVLPGTNPTANDLVTFFQTSSGLPRATTVGNLGIPAGNVPFGGTQGQILAKNSSTNFDASWDNIVQFVAAGQSLGTSGSATSIVIGVATAGIGSTQLGTFAVQSNNVATNAIGNVQFRQGSPLSVVGVAGNATTNVADIVAAATSGFVLQVNAGATGLVFAASPPPASNFAPFNATTLTNEGILYGQGTATVGVTAAGTTGLPLIGNGTAIAPSFQALSLVSGNVTGQLSVPFGGIGTSALASHGLAVGEGTSALTVVGATTAGLVLLSQGTALDPAYTSVVPQLTVATMTVTVATIASLSVTTATIASLTATNLTIATLTANILNVASAAVLNGTTTIAQAIFGGPLVLKTRNITAATPTVTVNATTDYLIALNGATAFLVNLPINPTTSGLSYLIKDAGGNASGTNTITIAAQTGNVDNATTYVITSSYNAVGVTYLSGANNTTQWMLS